MCLCPAKFPDGVLMVEVLYSCFMLLLHKLSNLCSQTISFTWLECICKMISPLPFLQKASASGSIICKIDIEIFEIYMALWFKQTFFYLKQFSFWPEFILNHSAKLFIYIYIYYIYNIFIIYIIKLVLMK
jgi:hypothetical protein